jgi:hypothetical protein
VPELPAQPPPDLTEPGTVAEPLDHNASNEATGGIWLLTGPAGDRRVLKIAKPGGGRTDLWAASDDPRHWNHWAREALAYRTGLAGSAYAGAGIAAPRLLDSADLPDGSVALWLEHVEGVPGAEWDTGTFADFATRLGAAQGAWHARGLPAYQWLSSGFLRASVEVHAVPGPFGWDLPVVAAAWPERLRAGLVELVAGVDELLAITEAAPRTLAHLDLWPANLIAAPGGPVLLDWAFTGDGALGEDPANLVIDSVTDGLIPVGALPDLVDAVTDGYLDGLRSAGARVDPDAVVRAMRAGGAAKYAWFAPRVVARLAAGGTVGSTFYDAGGTVTERLERWRPLLEMLCQWSAAALGR